MGGVAAGMECDPSSSPNNGNMVLATGGGKSGTHRDDRIVRASTLGLAPGLGHCGIEGSVMCLRGGVGWAMCAQGAWVDMGAVAAGTICKGGAVVGA